MSRKPRPLTLRQQEILGFIRYFFEQNGFWPTIREIQKHFNLASTNGIARHLVALERKGKIIRPPGRARAFRLADEVPTSSIPPEEAMDVIDIPVYGSIPAGYAEGIESGDAVGRLQIDPETAGINRSRRSFALKVRGDSMINAGIHDGDIVILEQRTPRHREIVAALIDGETTLKRFIQESNHPPYLKAENPMFPSLYPVSELLIQGVARSVVRQL